MMDKADRPSLKLWPLIGDGLLMADGSPAKAQRAIVAGYAVRELEDGQIKIEGQAPMSRSAANLFLAEAALSLARFNEPKPPQLDRDDSHDFDDLDALFAAGVDL